ncbi:MAG: hypothetical protein Q4G25_12390 [Paracoccus sp. (in: a-proteobacteria)]|nr:hypothetical protein [Paracoccus sp. (in: a-proteobacteria)]
MLRSLFRITPELLLVIAFLLLAIQMRENVLGIWQIARLGYPVENFDFWPRMIAGFTSSLYQPAILFGMAAIIAALRARHGD